MEQFAVVGDNPAVWQRGGENLFRSNFQGLSFHMEQFAVVGDNPAVWQRGGGRIFSDQIF